MDPLCRVSVQNRFETPARAHNKRPFFRSTHALSRGSLARASGDVRRKEVTDLLLDEAYSANNKHYNIHRVNVARKFHTATAAAAVRRSSVQNHLANCLHSPCAMRNQDLCGLSHNARFTATHIRRHAWHTSLTTNTSVFTPA